MIKLQPGYHCYLCPCFSGERGICRILNAEVKCDSNDRWLPAIPLADCPVSFIRLTDEGIDLRQFQIMGTFERTPTYDS